MNKGSMRVLHMGCGESLLGAAQLSKRCRDRNAALSAKCKSAWCKPERRRGTQR